MSADRRPTGPRLGVSGPLRLLRRSRDAAPALEEVHLLDGLAAALEAGMPTHRAVQLALDGASRAGVVRPEWAELRRAADLGQSLGPVWVRVARRTGSPTLAAAGRAWVVAVATGAPLAGAVRAAAHGARERHRLARALETATAGARATATVLGLLPLAGVGLASVLGVGPVTLYGSAPALASLVGGAGLLATGHAVVRAMVARVGGAG